MAATGLRQRHGNRCKRPASGCKCPWEANVYINAERRQLRQTFSTKAAAQSWRIDARAQANRGDLRSPTTTTVAQAAAAFLAGASEGYKPSTVRSYREALDGRILPELGHLRLSDVRRGNVQALADRLTREGLAPGTVRNTLDPLRAIYRRAVRREDVAVSPCENLDLRRASGKRDRIAAPQEAAALLAALPDTERALWATALYAGLRRGELQALRCSDVREGVIRVERGWDQYEGAQEGKTAAARRRVPILAPLAPILADHLRRTGRVGDALIFGRTEADAFVPSTARSRALRAWASAELKPIGLHECRHTFASLLIAAGVNAKAVSEAMGHATITMTYDTYGHLFPGAVDEVAAQANAYLARVGGEQPALRVVN